MQIDIKFRVEKKIYRNDENGYTVVRVKLINCPKDIIIPTVAPIVIGYFVDIHIDDEYEATGEWINDNENGYHFKASILTLVFSKSNNEMVKFLNKYVVSIGKTTAKKVVEEFKENSYNVILNNPEKLIDIGISANKASKMSKAIEEHRDFERLVFYLSPLGFTHCNIVMLHVKLGCYAIDSIRGNPYILCEYKEIGFKIIDNLAKILCFSGNNKFRIRAGILMYISMQIKNKGDMFVYENEIYEELPNHLIKYGAFESFVVEKEKIEKQIKEFAITNKLVLEYNLEGKACVYVAYYAYLEQMIAKTTIKRLAENSTLRYSKKEINEILYKHELKTGLKLDAKQKKAVHMAISSNISILGGGPGTGKTKTLNTIIDCITQLNPDSRIILCAPTGRAAKRMTELTGMEAKTIHRLIGLNKNEQDNTELIKVFADYLIIDEASMVDAYVFHSLLSVVSKTTKILIVGDHEQLPSVGAGLILRDFINSGFIPTTILTQIYRQAKDSQIVKNAHNIIVGKNEISLEKDKEDFYFINQPYKDKIGKLILQSINRLLITGFKLHDIQVISVLNDGDLGVKELNRRIQEEFNTRYPNMQEVQVSSSKYFRIKDRVIQTINNYTLGVFNGEIGIISKITTTSDGLNEIIVDFGDKKIYYDAITVCELELAYAITIHKSQGSEFDVVIMPFHSSLSFLLNRTTIYTGWTRAKKRVICIGDIDELSKGIDRIDNINRKSRLIEKMNMEMEYIT